MSMRDGDGWVVLPDGSRRWGLYGAAGLLLHSVDDSGVGHILLQYRAGWSHQGDTWSVPGGARGSRESSVTTAIREFGEEVHGSTDRLRVHGIHREDHGNWQYDTVLARLPACSPFRPGNSESVAIEWVPVHEVADRPLHPGFALVWPRVRDLCPQRLVVIVDTAGVVEHRLDGRPHGGAAARLRDTLGTLARDGLDGGALPGGESAHPLHRWFPTVRMVVDGEARAVESSADVDVVPAPDTGDDATVELARAHAATDRTVVVTADRGKRQRCVALGAHVADPEWLLRAARSG